MIVNEKTVTELIEGNMVATSDGLYNILRASSRQTSQLAAKVTVTSPFKLTFSVSLNYFITFPGGGKKFTIRYDEQSRRYWTLSNPAASKYVGMKNDGLYLNGITRDLIRNRLVLCYSTDLITWVPYKVVLENEDPFFHGFQCSSAVRRQRPRGRMPHGLPRTPRLALPPARRRHPEAPCASPTSETSDRHAPNPTARSAAPASLHGKAATPCGLPARGGDHRVRGTVDRHPSGAARRGGLSPVQSATASAQVSPHGSKG